jgi:redox-sensing transcriptional repressor
MHQDPAHRHGTAPDRVPDQTVGRLPIYRRCLTQAGAIGMEVINSLQLAQMAGTNAAQVRKDLSYLGELGTRGIGYDVAALAEHLSEVLGVGERRRVALIGFGRLGAALLGYRGFTERGFDIVGVFDADPDRVGTLVDARGAVPKGLTVRSVNGLEADLRDLGVEIAILAVPAPQAQPTAERIIEGGVSAILNFAPVTLDLPPGVLVRWVDMSSELQVLSYHLNRAR